MNAKGKASAPVTSIPTNEDAHHVVLVVLGGASGLAQQSGAGATALQGTPQPEAPDFLYTSLDTLQMEDKHMVLAVIGISRCVCVIT